MRRLTIIMLAAGLGALSAVASAGGEAAPDKIKVLVSVPPQAYFVEKIGASYVDVSVLVQPGQSPHTFEPTPRQVAGLDGTRVYFAVGLPFEQVILAKISSTLPGLLVVDTRKGITLLPAEAEPGGNAHSDGEMDPHVWLSPRLAKIQSRTICDALKEILPSHAAEFEVNLAAFDGELDALDKHIAGALSGLRGREFFVYHPAFGYFAAAYGLRQVAVEIDGKEPGARELAALIDRAKADGVRVIFVQPQFSARNARTVADAIGGVVIPMDPLAFDYVKNLKSMADLVSGALAPSLPADPGQ